MYGVLYTYLDSVEPNEYNKDYIIVYGRSLELKLYKEEHSLNGDMYFYEDWNSMLESVAKIREDGLYVDIIRI